MEVFYKLLETIEKGSIDNKATIENVELFVQSWKKEAESLQLRKADVSGSFYCFERHIDTGDCEKQCKECKIYEKR